MKKTTIAYSKALQKLIKDNEAVGGTTTWRTLPLMRYVHGLILHVDEIAMTGKVTQPLVPVVTPGYDYPLLDNNSKASSPIDILHQAYHSSRRLEVQVFSGQPDVCLGANFFFYQAGRNNVPILVLEGAVDSEGIRYLRVKK